MSSGGITDWGLIIKSVYTHTHTHTQYLQIIIKTTMQNTKIIILQIDYTLNFLNKISMYRLVHVPDPKAPVC